MNHQLMNKNDLIKLLEKISTKFQISDELKIKTLSTNMEGASKESAIFYKIHNNEKAIAAFQERCEKANPGLIITTHYVNNLEKYNYIIVEEEQYIESQKTLADFFYPLEDKMKLVGVTGTNGKTTVANLCVQISHQMNKKAFSIGTIGIFDHEKEIYPVPNATTPSYVELRKIISHFQNEYDVLFFEVSSHALEQKRIYDLKLDVCAWTSFSQDHLDYHKTLEEYFNAKALIANHCDKMFIPTSEIDLAKSLKDKGIAFEKAKTIKEREIINLSPAFGAKYNQDNLEISLALNEYIWGDVNIDHSKLMPPKGRFSTIEFSKGLVIVDYAHTPDALENVCKAIKDAFLDMSLTVVYGCGGDRDRGKRPLMSLAVSKYADEMIMTSDNPRTESPDQILDDMEKVDGLGEYNRISDRKEAIQFALEKSSEATVILIAGKGHEEYQDINGVKHPFSDFDISNELIKKLGLDV